MRAIEDLLGQVKDDRSRAQLAEATRAYGAGAFRAAIISTWVAVALDLVAKIRELADQGEANAVSKVTTLDAAISSTDRNALMAFERGLLDACRDDFEFIDARDHLALSRLYDDRHVCAHPAFVSPEVVFEPTPELVRAHFATAVDSVLRHGATPGKRAIDRFIAESKGNAWPSTFDDLTGYLRERYFERGKETLRRNLAQLIVKGCLDTDTGVGQLVKSRLVEAAHALDVVAPEVLQLALADVIRKREEGAGLSDEQIMSMIGSLGDLTSTWQTLPGTSISRVIALVKTADPDSLVKAGVFSVSVVEPDVATKVAERLPGLTNDQLEAAISLRPGVGQVNEALARLRAAGGWRSAEERMSRLVLPLAPHLTADHIGQVGDTLRSNEQVSQASGMPQLLDSLFEETKAVPGSAAAWRDIATFLEGNGRDNDPNDWYACPQLRQKIAKR
jgi:hypothetical protein